jgi:hypothetical protein
MRLRLLVHILAVFGVLAHAGALVRHNSVMVGATLEYNALLADIGSICHGDASSAGSLGSVPPAVPLPSNPHDACAICLGLVAAVALNVADAVSIPAPVEIKDTPFVGLDTIAEKPHALHPPARGPPVGV